MEKTIIIATEDNIFNYYGAWQASGDLEDFLNEHEGKKLKITVEVLEENNNHIYTDDKGVNSIM